MRHRVTHLPAAVVTAALLAGPAAARAGGDAPWGYAIGVTRAPAQANFCDEREDALEIAHIFERFGARTGFSALSNAPGCSLQVRGITPRSLLHRVRVELEDGGEYHVNFIHVETDDGSRLVLVTTRRLTE